MALVAPWWAVALVAVFICPTLAVIPFLIDEFLLPTPRVGDGSSVILFMIAYTYGIIGEVAVGIALGAAAHFGTGIPFFKAFLGGPVLLVVAAWVHVAVFVFRTLVLGHEPPPAP